MNQMSTIFKAKIKNDIDEMERLIADLIVFLNSHRIFDSMEFAVNLAVKEPLSIILNYGCNREFLKTIEVTVGIQSEDITILLVDDGRAFNLLRIPHLDPRKSSTDLPMGVLGMHMVRDVMQSMWYERKDGKNYFEIRIPRS
jgi:anti-sigma regulatory factor (Ser/Thr protein kinase)